MNKWYILGIIIIIVLGVTSTILYNKYSNNNYNNELVEENEIIENMIDSNIEIVSTASSEEKISPDCEFIFKTYYKKCEHTKVEKEYVSESIVNKTRQDIEDIYNDWIVVTFNNNQIVFYKEEEGECGEHYIIKEQDEFIAIYTIDENDNLKMKETTEISTIYLPEEDKEKLKEGIRVNGKLELNQTIEDFE